jgi:Vps16, C-terminal region
MLLEEKNIGSKVMVWSTVRINTEQGYFNNDFTLSYPTTPIFQLEEESSALSKALASGDRDLAYSVILHLRKKLSSTDFHMMIRCHCYKKNFVSDASAK